MIIFPGLAHSHRHDNLLSIGAPQSSSWSNHPASGCTPHIASVFGLRVGQEDPVDRSRPRQTQVPLPLQGGVLLGGTIRTHGGSLIPSASAGFGFAWFLRGDRFRSKNAKNQNNLRNRKRSLLNYELFRPRKSKLPISSGLRCITSRGAACPFLPENTDCAPECSGPERMISVECRRGHPFALSLIHSDQPESGFHAPLMFNSPSLNRLLDP
jgi:hypothetical protein